MNELNILNAAKKYYKFGVEIHWLWPKSKKPINMNWNKRPKENIESLIKNWRQDYNLGARLGPISKVGDFHLGVIDLDVKSDNPEHENEARAEIEKKFPTLKNTSPRTRSGRGHGSGHIFFKVNSKIVKGGRLASSQEKVRIRMPSVPPSQFEKLTLTEKELEAGIRIRNAWEIDIMLEGRQVVLPPSIHPDTGRRYEWVTPMLSIDDLPDLSEYLVDFESSIPSSSNISLLEIGLEFQPVVVDLEKRKISQETKLLILEGEGINSDRSLSLFVVACELCKAKFSDIEIISILTDKQNSIGHIAYEHTNSSSRTRAAKWIRNYTLKKAREETDPAFIFDCPVDNAILSEKEAIVSAKELMDMQPNDWKDKLDLTSNGKRKPTLKNMKTIVQKAVGVEVFKKDQFSNKVMYGINPPWNKRKVEDSITDEDITNIVYWFAVNWGMEPHELSVNQMVTQIASENQFHPVRDYLNSLEWDGIARINIFLKKYLYAKGPREYLSAISRKFLCAMVARVMEPGIKFDSILIFEGKQGIGKSTAASILGGKWFSDPSIVIGDKDSIQALLGKWVVEMGELSGLTKADVEKFKAYISCSEDDVRLPYGKRYEKYPRQSVFIGTTNSDQYLKDMSGNRRFWPVEVYGCDVDALKTDRDQLFAEALWVWNLGIEKLFLNEEESQLAMKEQDKRVFHDPIEDEIKNVLSSKDIIDFNPKEFTMAQLLKSMPNDSSRIDINSSRRVGAILRKLGYGNRSSNGNQLWSLK